MSDDREPLAPLTTNTPSPRRVISKRYAPIFTKHLGQSHVSASTSSASSPCTFPTSSPDLVLGTPNESEDDSFQPVRKRVRLASSSPRHHRVVDENDVYHVYHDEQARRLKETPSLHTFFASTPLRSDAYDHQRAKAAEPERTRVEEEHVAEVERPVWTRSRRRLGVGVHSRPDSLLDVSQRCKLCCAALT